MSEFNERNMLYNGHSITMMLSFAKTTIKVDQQELWWLSRHRASQHVLIIVWLSTINDAHTTPVHLLTTNNFFQYTTKCVSLSLTNYRRLH